MIGAAAQDEVQPVEETQPLRRNQQIGRLRGQPLPRGLERCRCRDGVARPFQRLREPRYGRRSFVDDQDRIRHADTPATPWPTQRSFRRSSNPSGANCLRLRRTAYDCILDPGGFAPRGPLSPSLAGAPRSPLTCDSPKFLTFFRGFGFWLPPMTCSSVQESQALFNPAVRRGVGSAPAGAPVARLTERTSEARQYIVLWNNPNTKPIGLFSRTTVFRCVPESCPRS